MRLGKGSRKSLFLHVNGVQYGSKTLCCHFTRAADDDRLSFVRLVVTFYGWGGYLRSMCRMRGENWCHTHCWPGLRLPNLLYPSAVNFARCGRSECKLIVELTQFERSKRRSIVQTDFASWNTSSERLVQTGTENWSARLKSFETANKNDCDWLSTAQFNFRASDRSTVEDEFFTSHKKESCPLSSNKSSFNVPCWLPQNYRHNPFI